MTFPLKNLFMGAKKLHLFILVMLALLTTVNFLTPLCGLLFQCGCVWNWAGGTMHCNIQHKIPPFCPWCAHKIIGSLLPVPGLFFGQFMTGLLVLRQTGKILLSSLVTVASFLPIGIVVGYITILLTGYPHFLTIH